MACTTKAMMYHLYIYKCLGWLRNNSIIIPFFHCRCGYCDVTIKVYHTTIIWPNGSCVMNSWIITQTQCSIIHHFYKDTNTITFPPCCRNEFLGAFVYMYMCMYVWVRMPCQIKDVCLSDTVRSRYIAVMFLWISHERHSIARPL